MAHVTFIHGIGNKPEAQVLLEIWLRTLSTGGIALNERCGISMVYWADVLYPASDPNVASYESVGDQGHEALEVSPLVQPPVPANVEQAAFIAGLAAKLGGTLAAAETPTAVPPDRTSHGAAAERVPLPWPLKKLFLENFLRDVHHYLFNVNHSPRPGVTFCVQDEIRRRFVEALKAIPSSQGPHIVVSHSMGTVIAYDCLKRVADCPNVDGLLTVGSPLGIDEIQDRLQPEWSRDDGFPEKVTGPWVNVFDRLDVVAGFDPFLANDYKRAGSKNIQDIEEPNYGPWRHSITKYLRGQRLRNALATMLDLD